MEKYGVVIIGAGAAGISLALALKSLKEKILLVDGGGDEYTQESQNMYVGEIIRRDLPSGLAGSRLRYFGGSTNCWSGGLGVFDDIDFKARHWVENSGWPITSKEILPYYKRAAEMLAVNLTLINANIDKEKIIFRDFDYRNIVYTKKVRFSVDFKNELDRQQNLTILKNYNLKEIRRGIGGISKLMLIDYQGNTKPVEAKKYIIATGGIENARLLLLTSKNEDMSDAIGNHSGHLGRYFCDHPIAPCATIYLNRNNSHLNLDINDIAPMEDTAYRPHLKIPDEIQEKYSILNSTLQFQTQELPLTEAEISAWRTYNYITNNTNEKPLSSDIKNIILNPFIIAKSAMRRKGYLPGGRRLAVRFQIEQAPRATNRIRLSNEVDRLGLRRTLLDFDYSKIERKTIDVLVSYLAFIMQRDGIGLLKYDEQLINGLQDSLMPADLRGGQHHSGTTRMSLEPKTGVVDTNLAVWNYPNLHILGGSCFPTNGWVNPTFTIIAMAFRLANHIETELKAE